MPRRKVSVMDHGLERTLPERAQNDVDDPPPTSLLDRQHPTPEDNTPPPTINLIFRGPDPMPIDTVLGWIGLGWIFESKFLIRA